MKIPEVKIIGDVDMSELEKAKEMLEEFNKLIERANSLANELTQKEVCITLISRYQVQNENRSVRKYSFLAKLKSFFCTQGTA